MTITDSEQTLRSYLRSGEHIRWIGRPVQGFRTSGRDVFLIPFSLLWGGFALFWEFSVASTPAPGFFKLWGVPFVLVGLYLIIGRFIVDAWVRSRMTYAVTDERAIVLRTVSSEKLLTASLDQQVRLQREQSGRGTIEFGPETPTLLGGRGWGVWKPSLSDQVRFIGIENVMDVYRLIGRAQGS